MFLLVPADGFGDAALEVVVGAEAELIAQGLDVADPVALAEDVVLQRGLGGCRWPHLQRASW